MSDDATYTFYPVVRAGHRPGSEFDGDEGSIPDSGETAVTLSVTGYDDDDRETTEEAAVAVHVYGPGDVTGLDERQIVRREPTPRTDAFPPRQFPVVEFDRPDLPWLFSPQRADVAGRVHPWLCLVVVDRDHPDVSYAAVGPGSLPALEAPVSELPDPAESYLWAHAQHLGTPGDGADVPAIAAESTHSRSRLLCPRNLEANTRYRAAVVPVFEPGRQAGLGRDPDPTNAFAWDAESGTVELPVYDSWTFITSPEGDFVSLATDLEPVVLGQDVGRRTVDVSKPGPTALKRPGEGAESTVGLEGALESPAAAALSDPYDPDLADRLRSLLNRSESLDEALPEDVVAPPLYGQWHASRSVVGAADASNADWFDQLNADPRYRMAAGFGTTVVQAEQEHLMAAAWEQFGDLREANGYLCRSQLVRESLRTTYDRIRTKSPGRLLQLSGPIHRHVFDDRLEGTVHSHVVGTTTPVGMTNPKFRGLTNSHGPLARRDGATLEAMAIATRIEEGLVPGQTLDAESKAVGSETDTVTDHDGVHELDPEAGVGAEFGGVDTSLDQDLATGPVGWSAPSFGDVGATGAGGPGGANVLAVTAGSEGPQLPPGVRSADPDADPADERYESRVARHRVLALCESVERHCLSARSVLSRLERAVDRQEHAQVVDLVRADPDPYRRAASIVPNTVEPLSRALSKLLIEPRPPTVAAELTSDVAADLCDRLRESGDRLEAAVEAALEAAVEGLSDPEAPLDAASPPLSSATTTISRMIGVVDRIRSMVAIEADADPTMAGAEGPTDADGMGAGFSTSMLKSQQFGPAPGAELAQADLEAVTDAILTELDPDRGLPAVVADRLNLPAIPDRLDPLEQIMAAPSFDRPMSESLVDLDPEHLLPGVGEVPDDSVGLVQTNPAFVEAFMAGLNHEMARLLRWRRYPTDKRGTYFRQFWDHRASPDVDTLEDIEELHRWSGALGSNDLEGDEQPTAVLLVRGELLRRYPNTMIYAAKATEDATGAIDDSDRIPALPNLYENVEEGDALDDENVRFPEFSGSLGDDVTFFGFDLTVPEARADPYHLPEEPAPDDHDDEGWFFVIEEPAADVRFGMLGGDDDESIDPIAETGEHVAVANEPGWYDGMSDDDGSGVNQSVEWGKNSAHMAHLTWRRPSRVAIHASELLPDPDDDSPFVIGEMPESFELADDLSFLTSPGSTSTDGGVDE
ncbi:hypothetical protein [Natronobeatus ordinarius]|uniref:hypothetical protein n=1 Tax=Natronobeatus ordinarius TaxID=2963433 RepID=UPI0020CCDBF0|nr:hypothetical protein [Natronobeatus ordinarius]